MEEAESSSFLKKNVRQASLVSSLIVGISAILAAMSGPLYRFDVIDLNTALNIILRMSITYGLGIGVLIAIITILLGLFYYKIHAFQYIRFAIISVIISIAVFAVPYSQLRRGAPPIHEISTDLTNPPGFIDILPLRANAPNPPEYISEITGYGMVVNVTEKQKEYYPDIQPLVIGSDDYKDIFSVAKESVLDMGWTLVSHDEASGRIEAYDTTTWFGFVDDVVIRITKTLDTNVFVIDVRSKSRVGFGDVGANAERIRGYLALIENK